MYQTIHLMFDFYSMKPSVRQFTDWVGEEGKHREANGVIGVRALFIFFISWLKTQREPITAFVEQYYPGPPDELVDLAFQMLERNDLTPPNNFPYLTDEAQKVFEQAERIAVTLQRGTIDQHHLLAAFLVCAFAYGDPDAYLGTKPGAFRQIRDAFLAFIKDAGYGEAWDYWNSIFQNSETHNAPRKDEAKSVDVTVRKLLEILEVPFRREQEGFDFLLDLPSGKSVAVETKAVSVGENDLRQFHDQVTRCKGSKFDAFWLVTLENPIEAQAKSFTETSKDENVSCEWIGLAKFAQRIGIQRRQTDLGFEGDFDWLSPTAGSKIQLKISKIPEKHTYPIDWQYHGAEARLKEEIIRRRLSMASEESRLFGNDPALEAKIEKYQRELASIQENPLMAQLTPEDIEYLNHDPSRETDKANQPRSRTQKEHPISEDGIRIGRRTHFSRIAAGDEVALGVQGYANVLTKLLRTSDEKDLCLAIFGPWGRGKTFLMEQTIGKLTEQNADGKQRYEVVRFSAWKYPSRPEVWVHLFESFFCRLIGVGWFRSLAFTILTGIQRHGVTKLWIAWVALMLTAMPKTWLLKGAVEYLAKFEFVIAAAIVFFVTVFLWEFWTTTSHLRRHYLSGTRHFEKLGLQGTIGNDLKALLKGWVQIQLRSSAIKLGLWLFWGAMIALVGVIFWRCHEALAVAITLSVIVLAIAAFVNVAFKFSAPSPSRILLVVDDLDRCQLDHLLAVMESIKLLLEDEEVSRRVQVVMLIEEDVLKHATWEKYKRLAESDAQKATGTNYDGKRIIRESFEKLFTAHLRLGPLKPQDVADIVFNFGGKAERVESSAASGTLQAEQGVLSQQSTPNSGVVESSAADDKSDRAQRRKSHDPAPNEIGGSKGHAEQARLPSGNHFDTDFTMSSHEKQVILAALHAIYGDKQSELGPRALRAIMFRYQLARLLLEELGEKTWSPAMLAMMVVERHLEGRSDAKQAHEDSDILTSVAEQVA
jgi:hypothetical protein